MVLAKTLLGLDLGAHGLKAVELRQGLRGLETMRSKAGPQGGEDAPPGEAIREFLDRHAFSTDNVICAISGQRIANRRLEFPFRDRKRLSQAIPFEIESTMPFDVDDLVVDWQLVAGERSHAVVAASVAQKQDVADFLEVMEAAQCSPRILEAEGLVLGNLALIFDLPGTRLLADIGHRKTTLCLCVDGKPLAGRTVPIGGMNLTEAVAKDRDVELDQAEGLKHGLSVLDDVNADGDSAALAILDRLARELVRSFDALDPSAGAAMSLPDCEIVLMGGTAHLAGINAFLEARTGVPTRGLTAPDDPKNAALVEGLDLLLFGPTIALALRATSRALTTVNFRQDEFSFRSSYGWLLGPELRPTLAMGLLCLILFGLSGATSIQLQASRAAQLESTMVARYAAIFPDRPIPEQPLSALAEEVASDRARADFLGLYGGNLSALDLLTLLSKRIPADLTLKFDEINIDQNVIRIKVSAKNYEAQDRLENVLRAEPVFAAADVTGSAKRLKNGSVTFGLSIPLQPGEENL